MSIQDEVRDLRRRVADLEAAHLLMEMRGQYSDEQLLAEACEQIKVGIAMVQSGSRAPDAVRARSFLATNLHRRMGWTVKRIAKAMHKEPRGIRKMIARTS
jgi:hypothetical protein